MVERSIYMECEEGHLHATVFSDILIRRLSDFSVAEVGERNYSSIIYISSQLSWLLVSQKMKEF